MIHWRIVLAVLTAVLLVGHSSNIIAQQPQPARGKGLIAIEQAAKANKYLFIFFYREQDDRTGAMSHVFNEAVKSLAGRADSVMVPISDPAEAAILGRFQVSRAPMPLVLTLAPNGAVTGGFPGNFTKEQLLGSFATPCMERLLKAIQDGKLVVLCLQNGQTRLNAEAMRGVQSFKEDQRYSRAVEVLMLDPSSAVERPLLLKLGIRTAVEEAITLLVAPPGSVIGSFKGATDKNQLVSTLMSAASGCGAGCQPGQCGVSN
ncbi:MAG: hypothetical protein AB1733_07700 [Thermodesulfobacteriota bacterium]